MKPAPPRGSRRTLTGPPSTRGSRADRRQRRVRAKPCRGTWWSGPQRSNWGKITGTPPRIAWPSSKRARSMSGSARSRPPAPSSRVVRRRAGRSQTRPRRCSADGRLPLEFERGDVQRIGRHDRWMVTDGRRGCSGGRVAGLIPPALPADTGRSIDHLLTPSTTMPIRFVSAGADRG